MSHRMIINFPIEFWFQQTPVEWFQASARFTGWARRVDGTVDGGNLIAEITLNGLTRDIRIPLRRLPGDRPFGFWLQAYTDDDVERELAGYEPLLFVPKTATPQGEEKQSANGQSSDAWTLREEFLRVTPGIQSWFMFLKKWGRWNSQEFIEPEDCTQLQKAIRDAVTGSVEQWFADPNVIPSDCRRSSQFPFLVLHTDKIETALRVSVTDDLLKQTKFKICARTDCGQPFKAESQHDKKFCSQKCAHLEAVRRSRRKTNKDTVNTANGLD